MTDDVEKDRQHLELIVILHYVSGILGVLTACLPLIHFGFGIAMLNGVFPNPRTFPTGRRSRSSWACSSRSWPAPRSSSAN